jgi:hypothetical protein
MRIRRLLAVLVGLVILSPGPAAASHGPTRTGTDPCNGTDAFDINNVITRDVVDTIAAQNPGSVRPDGTIDRTKITHALLQASGHLAVQIREKTGSPLDRVSFEFSRADGTWTLNSTNHPGYLTAIDAREDPARDIDSDLVAGRTFVFFIPTDVVSDGTYVARFRGFTAAGAEVGRICVDALVANGQDPAGAARANTDPAYEPTEAGAGYGYTPQPVVWFPAAEPSAVQQAGYGPQALRIEFAERLSAGSLRVERDEAGIWVNYTSLLAPADVRRPHFVAGGRFDGSGGEGLANEKTWGPGYRFPFDQLPGSTLPSERLRISSQDVAGKSFCGVYTFTAGPNGSFLVSAPAAC